MTGLNASTLFRECIQEYKRYWVSMEEYPEESKKNWKRYYDLRVQLTEKLDAQEKELEELREAASELAETWHDVYDDDVVITP